jgi:hypothetical protein
MKWVGWMAAVCLASWQLIAYASPQAQAAVFFGMLGPFIAVATTWVLVERTARLNPSGLTSLMMAAFAVKMGFFALYVVAVLSAGQVDRTPFVVSFTGYFIALYGAEALLMQRLFASQRTKA